MNHRQVGLLNVQYADNYGANFIAYAMEQTVNDILGETTSIHTIDYRPDLLIVNAETSTIKNTYLQFGLGAAIRVATCRIKCAMIRSLRPLKVLPPVNWLLHIRRQKYMSTNEPCQMYDPVLRSARLQKFERFRDLYLHRTPQCSKEELQAFEYDTIIVGSDVVWKPQRLLSDEVRDVFFLSFGRNHKRVAYAASLGISDKGEMHRLRNRYRKMIKPFDAVSIRETSGTEYVQSLFEDKIIHHCIDPVFLRKQSEYAAMVPQSQTQKPFIYAYILGDNPNAHNYVAQLSREKGMHVLYHTSPKTIFENGTTTYTDGPLEFLERVKNADYVITDSFHGTAFSIIFRKRFFSFTRGILSVRLEDFLSQIGLSSRLLEKATKDTNIDAPIDYEKVWNCLDRWIVSSMTFLKNAITDNGETL